MEKRTPHCKLDQVKALIAAKKYRMTRTALSGGAALGLCEKDMLQVIKALTMKDFYKSMTTYNDSSIWQDVYRPHTAVGKIYLKLTVTHDLLVVSFKESES